ncbi:uncharacterized protein [Triticum aestivum]|uniref:uncharacterized protein n=1 Tax=Triticum aestivum TaxID=4565 RepID=UPI001D010B78|nr:uncharacterized protein LOC123133440 [Triticum aestivum]
MEAKKKAAAVAAMCLLLLLMLPKPSHQKTSKQGPLSDVDCECYRQCYPRCKDSTPPWLCKVKCATGCPLSGPGHTFNGILVCFDACNSDSICDLPAPLANAEVCKHWCLGAN